MSYLAIARKYRPQTFAEVVGQEHVTRTLQNAIKAERLHHAYLFTGVRGVGKTTIARILAKTVNCLELKVGEPCNQCDHCLDITNGKSLSVQEIDGASNTSVDDIREIRENVKYMPPSGKYKIYIIDEVHMLSTSAFNALLKTLEEPPPHVIFLFATTEVQKLPATILSRCQRYDLRRVGLTRIRELLIDIAKQEDVTIDEEALTVIAREADGSIRDAESLLDQAIAYAGNSVRYADLQELLGFLDRRQIIQAMQAIIEKKPLVLLEITQELFEAGANLSRFTTELLDRFHALYLLVSGGNSAYLEMAPSEMDHLKKLGQNVSPEMALQYSRVLYRGAEEIVRSRFPRMVLETTLLQMGQVRAVQSVDLLMKQAEQLIQKVSQAAPHPSAPPVATVENLKPPPEPTAVETKKWGDFLGWIQKERPQVESILSHGDVSEFGKGGIRISYPAGSIYGEMLEESERKESVENLVEHFFGERWPVFVIKKSGGESDALSKRRLELDEQEKRRRAMVEEATSNQMVKEASSLFGASIEDIKVERK